MEELKNAVAGAVKNVFDLEVEPELTRPDEQFGDYSTNVAMQLGQKLNKNPKEIAIAIAGKLHSKPELAEVNIAGPGFINFKLSDDKLAQAAWLATELPRPLEGREILVEFGDPNPFKEMHIGHLYSYIVGDSISRLLETQGAAVRRLSYHGDVGLHVAKAIWGMQQSGVDLSSTLDVISHNLGKYYQEGARAYEKDGQAKAEIETVNQKIYSQDDEGITKLYEWGKERSFNYFKNVLDDLGIKIDKQYLESESADAGIKFVRQHLGSVFKESDGAIVYEGEKVGLHTRVFITSKGLPTYETKDLGLAELKNKDYPDASKSIIITAHEQSEYFKVMLAALKEFDKPVANKTTHLWHGFVTLSTGKMSSRAGEVMPATDLLARVKNEAKILYPDSHEGVHLAAIKYGFLKHRLGADIVYDVQESVSLEGNSGPYLQYAYARAQSILDKASQTAEQPRMYNYAFTPSERTLVRTISEFPEIVQKAAEEFLPSHVATYLYELAQDFNKFYENNRVLGSDIEVDRLSLVSNFMGVLKNGLGLLNIEAPERM